MDYNSQPWTYEVVCIDERDTVSHVFLDETRARDLYEYMKPLHKTVLFCHSRKGVVRGQYEI